MDVLYVITKSNWGGAQKYVYELARTASGEGKRVAVALGGKGPLLQKLQELGIEVYVVPSLGRDISIVDDWRSFRFLLRLFKKHRPDVVHLNSSKIGVLGAVAGRLARIRRIIFTAHGFAFNEERPALARALLKALYWLAIALSHRTIAVSHALKEQMSGLPFMASRMHVIYNALPRTMFLSGRDAKRSLGTKHKQLKQWLAANPEGLLLGTIAELHPIKGLSDVIKAVSGDESIAYAIIGDGQLRSALSDLVREQHAEERIFLLGALPDAAQYLHAFDIFVLPSHSEAFPYVLLEAGGAGLPVIATSVGGIPEIIDDGTSGLLVPPRHPSMLAHAVRRLAHDPDLRHALGTALKKKTAEFTPEKMRKETYALYYR